MPREIERKFLVNAERWVPGEKASHCKQGYLAVGPPVAVRVRIMEGVGTINIKSASTDISRMEFEYEIPVEDAGELLAGACVGRVVEKTRHYIEYGGLTWEVDVFEGLNAGLVLAEVELGRADQDIELPPWVGLEVSGDPRYLNSYLSHNPYSVWKKRR